MYSMKNRQENQVPDSSKRVKIATRVVGKAIPNFEIPQFIKLQVSELRQTKKKKKEVCNNYQRITPKKGGGL